MEKRKIPDVLEMPDGTRAGGVGKWNVRRKQILELFEREVYGVVPDRLDTTNIKSDYQRVGYDGKINCAKWTLTVKKGERSFSFPVWSYAPYGSYGKRLPTFVYCMLKNQAEQSDLDTDVHMDFVPVEQIAARGYAVLIYRVTDIAPDAYDGFQSGVFAAFDDEERRPDSWATIAAWAWAGSRVMDCICSGIDVFDKTRACIIGHSRGGKTALWCGACDPRYSMVVSNNSGCTGAAISRGKQGETVEAINTQFPHWFCENYKKYGGKEEQLPVDQHMLLSLIAPRLLYVTSASEDLWADPESELLACHLASPVYRLYRKKGVKAPAKVELNRQYGEGSIAYHRREGVHKLTAFDWDLIMDYADIHLK